MLSNTGQCQWPSELQSSCDLKNKLGTKDGYAHLLDNVVSNSIFQLTNNHLLLITGEKTKRIWSTSLKPLKILKIR
jgi:hypothetical protein